MEPMDQIQFFQQLHLLVEVALVWEEEMVVLLLENQEDLAVVLEEEDLTQVDLEINHQ